MKQYELTGGARIGGAKASYPFAKLKVTANKFELDASIIGNLVFSPSDIISIEPYQQIPIIGKGIKITHNVAKYKKKVIFWTFKNPKEVINEIRKTGFLDNMNSNISGDDEEIIAKQKQGGFPIKKSFATGAVILWNLFFAISIFKYFQNPADEMIIGNTMKIAFVLVLGTALLTLFSKPFQQLILKEGRKLDDIKRFLYFIILVSSLLLLNVMIITGLS